MSIFAGTGEVHDRIDGPVSGCILSLTLLGLSFEATEGARAWSTHSEGVERLQQVKHLRVNLDHLSRLRCELLLELDLDLLLHPSKEASVQRI
jgi:hypothetical protein